MPTADNRHRWYAGIGSRKTPADMRTMIETLGAALATDGWSLCSGGARGADTWFANGSRSAGGSMEIFLPVARQGDAGIDASRLPTSTKAHELARQPHPAWDRLSQDVQRLIARNVNQILGPGLDDPVRFVVCWAPGSRMKNGLVVDVVGGTGLAVRLAASRDIPVFNLHEPEHRQRIERWIERMDMGSAPRSAP